ncbi:uncharacterized protein MYCFIDRAFT_170317 [Pseudocercospora fijiensis CIRAD86]|uniref:Uncharacterized protein n=1 Tax=Pseudocercospora fijiensis (strain CIRAD86) TaxID=383855 RepID=N1QBU0_PSEFD|nr:uncharacterized protein MYCFIDRAFT_170317 [Pseudocercospora fijiensis CIRAD86]EME88732.1 hypothetical protein MYCFIDRAFT_170317 [Pseudocercospora fijiensis CIRAD86]
MVQHDLNALGFPNSFEACTNQDFKPAPRADANPIRASLLTGYTMMPGFPPFTSSPESRKPSTTSWRMVPVCSSNFLVSALQLQHGHQWKSQRFHSTSSFWKKAQTSRACNKNSILTEETFLLLQNPALPVTICSPLLDPTEYRGKMVQFREFHDAPHRLYPSELWKLRRFPYIIKTKRELKDKGVVLKSSPGGGGHNWHASIINERQEFCIRRGLPVTPAPTRKKRGLISRLQKADEDMVFRFLDLPPELRVQVYVAFLESIREELPEHPIDRVYVQPPITAVNRLIRQEALPEFYKVLPPRLEVWTRVPGATERWSNSSTAFAVCSFLAEKFITKAHRDTLDHVKSLNLVGTTEEGDPGSGSWQIELDLHAGTAKIDINELRDDDLKAKVFANKDPVQIHQIMARSSYALKIGVQSRRSSCPLRRHESMELPDEWRRAFREDQDSALSILPILLLGFFQFEAFLAVQLRLPTSDCCSTQLVNRQHLRILIGTSLRSDQCLQSMGRQPIQENYIQAITHRSSILPSLASKFVIVLHITPIGMTEPSFTTRMKRRRGEGEGWWDIMVDFKAGNGAGQLGKKDEPVQEVMDARLAGFVEWRKGSGGRLRLQLHDVDAVQALTGFKKLEAKPSAASHNGLNGQQQSNPSYHVQKVPSPRKSQARRLPQYRL